MAKTKKRLSPVREETIREVIKFLLALEVEDGAISIMSGLYNRDAVRQIADHFGVSVQTRDLIINTYLGEIRKQGSFFADPDLSAQAVGIAKRGASEKTLKRLLSTLIAEGWIDASLTVARLLKRELTRDEVWDLIRKYIDGGSVSDAGDHEVIDLSVRLLSLDDQAIVKALIQERNRRWASTID